MALVQGILTPDPDGTTTVFTIPLALKSGSEQIFRQGIAQYVRPSGTPVVGEITISGTTVTFPASPLAPKTGDKLVFYGDTL